VTATSTGDVDLGPARDWEEVRRAAIGAGRTFPNRVPEEPFFFERTVRAPTLPLENTVLLRTDGRIASQLQVYERQLRVGDARAWTGAIGNVYTLPEYQGEGLGTRLLEYTREYLADRGYALSVLHTGVPEFYRRAGWEPVPFDRHRVDDPAPAAGEGADAFEPFEPADLDRLIELYRASRGTEPGSVYRPRLLWTDWILDPSMEVVADPRQVQLYRPDGDAEGYAVVDETDGGVACLEVGYAGDDEASFLAACWALLGERAGASGAVEWHPPVADALDELAGGFESRNRSGDMVQVHAPGDVSRLTGGDVEDTADLVEYLDRGGFYWSNVDSF